jgi:hypothetical protein
MNTSIGGKAARMFFCLAAAVFSGMILFGCANDTAVGGSGSGNNALVLPSGQGWTFEGGNGRSGCLFLADGRVIEIEQDYYYGQTWRTGKEGTYTVNGQYVTINFGSGDYRNGTYEFALSDNGKTLTAMPSNGSTPQVLTRTSGVNVTIPPYNPGTGGYLVLGSGQAWVMSRDNESVGIIFRSDNTLSLIYNYDGTWKLNYEGTYTTSGGRITIYRDGYGSVSGKYTVSGNTVIITIEGSTDVFTKTSNIIISDSNPNNGGDTGGNLVLSSGQAWVYNDGSREDGYIFLADGKVLYINRYYYDDLWTVDQEGTYQTNGANITIRWNQWGNEYGTYTVSGNSLTLKIDGESSWNLTRTSGVNITNTNPPPPPPPSGGDIVLSSGQAWVNVYDDYALIFGSDGSFKMIQKISNGNWIVLDGSGTYKTSGGNITLFTDYESYYGTYYVSGSTLTITIDGETEVFTKTSGINVTTPPTPSGGDLVLSSGQAWTTDGDSYSDDAEGYVFKSNGEILYIYGNYGIWYIIQEGTYRAIGADITVTWNEWGTEYGTYSIYGDELILTLDSYNYVLTKTSNVYPEYDPYYYYAPSTSLGLRKKTERAKSPKFFRTKAGARISKAPESNNVKPDFKKKTLSGVNKPFGIFKDGGANAENHSTNFRKGR